jgi:peptide/nickel transport system permease protein
VITLWAAITTNFLIPRLMPGNPALAMMARFHGHINPSALHALEIAFGVNNHHSLLSSYFSYLGNIFRGRLGVSVTFFPDSVTHDVLQALPWTLALIGTTTILAFLLGTLIGLVSAWRRGGWLDSVLPPIFVITSAFPYFWLALIAIWFFAIKHTWLPLSGGYDVTGTSVGWTWAFVGDALVHSILPALTILVTSIGGWILTMRNNTISVLTEDYVRMARAKGLSPWRIMWTYAGRNAILPNLTGFAMSLGFVVSGAILVEFVFNYPGVGWMFLQSVENQDYPLMQGLFLMIVVAVLTAILVADAATAILDPRTRDVR